MFTFFKDSQICLNFLGSFSELKKKLKSYDKYSGIENLGDDELYEYLKIGSYRFISNRNNYEDAIIYTEVFRDNIVFGQSFKYEFIDKNKAILSIENENHFALFYQIKEQFFVILSDVKNSSELFVIKKAFTIISEEKSVIIFSNENENCKKKQITIIVNSETDCLLFVDELTGVQYIKKIYLSDIVQDKTFVHRHIGYGHKNYFV